MYHTNILLTIEVITSIITLQILGQKYAKISEISKKYDIMSSKDFRQ